MPKLNYRISFSVFVVCAALVALIMANAYHSVTKTTLVAVAKTDLAPAQAAQPKSIGMKRLPANALDSQTIVRPDLIKDRITRGFIPAGTVLRKSMFLPAGQAGAAAQLSPGTVAIALDADIHTTCADEIRNGSFVTVFSARGGSVNVITEKTRVLSISKERKAVVLELTPEAAHLMAAERQGHGQIVLCLLPLSPEKGPL
ncbi:MAG: SAF domain-containing protein [Solirubrobacterales bacterium]